MRRVLLVVLLAVPIALLSGCGENMLKFMGDENSNEAKKVEVLAALDAGDYAKVIDKLENDPEYQNAFTPEERNMNIAAAYLGAAGFDAPTLLNDMIQASDIGNAASLTDATEPAQAFLDILQGKAQDRGAIENMGKAADNYFLVYNSATNGQSCAFVKQTQPALYNSLTDVQKDACYNESLSALAEGFTSIAVVIGDVDRWLDPEACEGSVSDDAEAAACATTIANGGASCSGAAFASPRELNFTGLDPVNAYLVTVTASSCPSPANKFYKLVFNSGLFSSPVVTIGFCKTDFSDCSDVNADGTIDESDVNFSNQNLNTCWPCPLTSDGAPVTYTSSIVETLNSGIDSLTVLIGDETVAEAVGELKESVCPEGQPDCTITEQVIADFLTQQQQ